MGNFYKKYILLIFITKKYGKNKKNTELFIEKSRKIHGDKYDYSKVEYVNAHTKVCIICPIHGEFWQTPNRHLNGCGCDKCGKTYSYSTTEWIDEARKIHGDKYDYSKVEYIDAHTKVCIICPTHGEFWQTPNSHLSGHGCKECFEEKKKTLYNYTTEEFIEKARQIHGDKYDYSKVEYVNNRTKVCIICPIHSEFWQTPYKHLNSCGCAKCSKKHKYTKVEFIEKARQIHGDEYDYSKVEYVNNKTKVCIICPTHGEFWQTPYRHLNGCGCAKCNSSHLENEIRLLLTENKLDFEEQKKFNWLGKQSLDFYLPKYKVAIECQGIQHFKNVEYFGNEELGKNIERDERKRKLCEENGIKLLYYSNLKIEYPYFVFENKEKMLKEFLERNKVYDYPQERGS